VSGNGQKELAEAIAGLRKIESGRISLFGKDLTKIRPRERIDQGLGYIPEDRNSEGIVPSFSVKENFILKDFASPDFSNGPFLKLKNGEQKAVELKEKFDIRCPGVTTPAGALSGGNIQKVILARELARNPKVLIAVYPTRGLDMGAEEYIHKKLLEMRRQGTAILLISEELEEIMNLSDRIAVIYKGKILRILTSQEASLRSIGLLMAGITEPMAMEAEQ